MDLLARIRVVGREVAGGTFVVRLGDAVPTVPRLLGSALVEVGTLGGAPHFECAVDTSPRPVAFWQRLAEQADDFLRGAPEPLAIRLVLHVLGALAADPERDPIEQRLRAALAPVPPADRAAA